jgi:hypothetical protein
MSTPSVQAWQALIDAQVAALNLAPGTTVDVSVKSASGAVGPVVVTTK